MTASFLLRATRSLLPAFAVLLSLASAAWASDTDIANQPLEQLQIKTSPNLLLVMDTSGSMGWSFMPDDLGNTAAYSTKYTPDPAYNGGACTGSFSCVSNPLPNWYGYWSPQCNGVAYDPKRAYLPPQNADGSYYANASYGTKTWVNGYKASDGTSDLTDNYFFVYNNGTAGTADPSTTTSGGTSLIVPMGWTYTASGVTTTTDFYKQCSSTVPSITTTVCTTSSSTSTTCKTGTSTSTTTVAATGTPGHNGTTYTTVTTTVAGGSPGSSVFTPVLTSSLLSGSAPTYPTDTTSATYATDLATAKNTLITSAQQTNYANWFAYYSHRYLLMRTAMGQAMQAFNPTHLTTSPGYRVGFSTIYDTTAKDSTSNFVSVNDFTASQMSSFYTNLYAVTPSGGTNLPDALSEAGRYYAHLISGQTADPMQYACQRNYTLMTTDGYWNSNSNDFQLDGATRVGNQDAGEATPLWDGTTTTVTTTIPWTANATRNSTLTQTGTVIWTVKGTTTSSFNSGNSSKPYYITSQTTQTYTEYLTKTTVSPQTGTSTYNETVVTTNGTQTSDTGAPSSSTPVSVASWSTGSPSTSTTPTVAPSSLPVTTANYYASTSQWSGTPVVTSGTTGWGSVVSTQTCNSASNCPTTAPSASAANKWTYTVSPSAQQSAWSSGSTVVSSATAGNYTQGTSTSSSTTSGGSSNTLADVAEYYYKTDLRTTALGNCQGAVSSNVCTDAVPTTAGDPEKFQHMNTFTIGLGVNGTLPTNTDALKAQQLAGLTAGTISWPVPSTSGDARNVDDLWHAALNGRGTYFSALNADQLSNAISSVVNAIGQVQGAGSGSSTSSLALVQAGNQIYTASFTTSLWTGDLIAQTLSGDGVIGSQVWSAQDVLTNSTSYSARKIWFNKSGTLTAFTYGNLPSTQQAYFTGLCSKTVVASQCATLNTADKNTANDGATLVNYLSGQRDFEKAGAAGLSSTTTQSAVYRARSGVLGDIIDGAPVYVAKPPFNYSDAGYSDFVTAQANRTPTIYTAANDGMLHAFRSDTGAEAWAFVPTPMMPNMYQLANANYSARHRYFVDGAPVEGDVYIGAKWKTILVGGFNSGGQGYYALDITDPANPKMLWEFSDTNMGLSYGNPIITKNAAGTWVVVFTSGYNNGSDTGGDGNGHLYVVDAASGTKLRDIATFTDTTRTSVGSKAAGSSGAPSGLGQIQAWIDLAANNQSLRFYGGDMLGNVWRFDTDSLVTPNLAALAIATLKAPDGTTVQPITTRPETLSLSQRAAIAVGTGRYLGQSDIADSTQQSLYVIADNLDKVPSATWNGWGNPRTNTAAFVKATVTPNGTTSGATPTATAATVTGTNSNTSNASLTVDWTNTSFGGWFMDLPNAGTAGATERVFTDMVLTGTELTLATGIPSGDACQSGGKSWFYYLNLASANGTALQFSTTAMIVGLGQIVDASGNIRDIVNTSDANVQLKTPPVSIVTSAGSTNRTSWRELMN